MLVRSATQACTADEPIEGKLHAAVVPAPAARGRVLGINRQAALAHPGVVAVYGIGDLPALRPAGFTQWLNDDAVHFARANSESWHGLFRIFKPDWDRMVTIWVFEHMAAICYEQDFHAEAFRRIGVHARLIPAFRSE